MTRTLWFCVKVAALVAVAWYLAERQPGQVSLEWWGYRIDTSVGLLLLAAGVGSVWYWHQKDDLRPYILVQYYPLLVMAVLLPTHPVPEDRALYGGMLGWYVLAKAAEALDRRIYRWTGQLLSGHTLKHLLATVATAWALPSQSVAHGGFHHLDVGP